MITVVNYDSDASKPIADVLSNLNIDHVVSKREKDIISANKIILPNGTDIRIIFKKLQLLNMYSLLKMVKKPVLGIGTGMFLMCDNIDDGKICGLGMLPVSNLSNLKHETGDETEVRVIKESKLFDGIQQTSKFTITDKYKIPVCNSTTALLNFDGVDYSAAIETNNNRFGILFSPGLSGENGAKLISNFANL